jgi:5-methylcytosine-specific restriction protein B
VEGIRAKTEGGQIIYKVEEGVFKRLCRDAFNTLLVESRVNKSWNDRADVPTLTEEEISRVKEVLNKGSHTKFFLIIDEINRGDISKILGELITLLEADKRLFSENEIIATLPYSKTKFGIPPNLYIIGTMNTADRSIALIDVALRRRFGFLEMMPSYAVLLNALLEEKSIEEELTEEKAIDIITGWKKEEIDHWNVDDPNDLRKLAIKVLYTLNQKIQLIYDRDHQIGHSYLLRLRDRDYVQKSLEFIWYNEIVPLLQEYFYNDWEKLKYILGGFVDERNLSNFADGEIVDREDARVFDIRVYEGEEFIQKLKDLVVEAEKHSEKT